MGQKLFKLQKEGQDQVLLLNIRISATFLNKYYIFQDVFERLMKERRPRMLVKPSCSKNPNNEFRYKNVYDKKRGTV